MIKVGSASHDGFPEMRKKLYRTEFLTMESRELLTENVAADIETTKSAEETALELMQLWWYSDPHRVNILDNRSDYSEIGIGLAKGISDKDPVWYATQIFAAKIND
jgi:uncharacterized protein YkwD